MLYYNVLMDYHGDGLAQAQPPGGGKIVMESAKNAHVEAGVRELSRGSQRWIGWTVLETAAYIQQCVLGGSFIEPTPVKPGPALSSDVMP